MTFIVIIRYNKYLYINFFIIADNYNKFMTVFSFSY